MPILAQVHIASFLILTRPPLPDPLCGVTGGEAMRAFTPVLVYRLCCYTGGLFGV